MGEMTIAAKAALAVDELLDQERDLRAAGCESAEDNYWALVSFYRARNEVFELIPGCEELIVTDFAEELREFVDENEDELFAEWADAGEEPKKLYLTESAEKRYRDYLQKQSE